MVKNKDIIMFLGDTGTGKSTTIHFLADSKMRRVKINGIEHIEPDPNSIKIK
jgi:flagellar biosynthesis GTPase FlhF